MSELHDPQQEKACQLRASGLAQEGAYAGAGYAEANNASRFFRQPQVRARVAQIKRRRAVLADLDEGWVLHQLRAVAKNAEIVGNSNLDDYFAHAEDGTRIGIELTDVSRAKMAALEEVTIEQYTEGPRDNPQSIKRTKVKLRSASNAIAAAELIGKYFGMWRDKLALTDPSGEGPAEISFRWKSSSTTSPEPNSSRSTSAGDASPAL